jgi:hypothetical protein
MPMQNVFTGKNATILLNNGDTNGGPERAAAGQVLSAYLGAKPPVVVGRATGVHIAVTTNLEEFHEIGHRHAVVLHPGDISISGSLDHAYVSGALISLLLGKGVLGKGIGDEPYPQPAFDMTVQLKDTAVPGAVAELVLTGVKFHNWAFRLPEDEFVMENVTFRALRMTINDTPTPAEGSGKINPFGAAAPT